MNPNVPAVNVAATLPTEAEFAAGAMPAPRDPSQGSQERSWQLVRAILRGRLWWLLVLSLLLGGTAAAAGWFLSRPVYRSGVPLRVVPILPRVLYRDEEKGALPQFESFVGTQIALLQSQRVLEGAVDRLAANEHWRRTHGGPDGKQLDGAVVRLAQNIEVRRNNELVMVYADDPDPRCAMLAAQAIVDTFRALYLETDSETDRQRLAVLQQHETTLNNDLRSKRQQIAAITDAYGTQNVDALYQAKFDQVLKLQAAMADLQLDMTLAVAGQTQAAEPLAVEQLSVTDPILAELIRARDQLDAKLTALRSQNLLPEHKEVAAAMAELGRLNTRITERIDALRALPQAGMAGARALSGAPLDPRTLRVQLDEVGKMLEQSRKQMLELSAACAQVAVLKEEIEAIQRQLSQTRERIDQLNIESRVGGRISVLGDAQRPLEPYVDPRKRRSALGGMGGAALAFMIVLIHGLVDHRLRHAEELRLRLNTDQILGLLPQLPDVTDPQQTALVSHAVHHIRTMLQLRTRLPGGHAPVFAITSPLAGAGKTSLSLGLGFSFASTGCRTLLIDCDLIGGGLTWRTRSLLRRKLGRILVAQRVISEAQLKSALSQSADRTQRLGQRLIELGHATAAQVDEALRLQSLPPAGLVEALHGAPLHRCLTRTEVPGLWLLPLGNARPVDAASLSPSALAALLGEVRKHFDAVIVDTGPVPGSLEASVVSAQADAVVLIVARGQSANAVQQSLRHLRSVKARLCGIVFNRARPDDAEVQSTTRLLSSAIQRGERSSRSNGNGSASAGKNGAASDRISDTGDGFGPVAQAVVPPAIAAAASKSGAAHQAN